MGTCLAALLGGLVARADTPINGTVGGVSIWTTNGSPYVITGSGATVPSTARLTIEAGVAVRISEPSTFTINGTLIASGTLENPVRFLPPVGNSRGGTLNFLGNGFAGMATGLLSRCEILGLRGTGFGGVVRGEFADFTLHDSNVHDILTTAIRFVNSRVQVIGNRVSNTSESMNFVFCAGVIASNSISQVNYYADGIDIDAAWAGPGDGSLLLDGNVVIGGTDPNADGIDFGTARNVVFRNNVVKNFNDKAYSIGENSVVTGYNNIAVGCTIGVAIKSGSDPDLSNFTIIDCTNGVSVYMDGGTVPKGRVVNSIIWGGRTPISIQNGTTTIRHSVTPGATPWPGFGNITNNPSFINAGAGDYRLKPDSPCINAGSNAFWMTTASDLGGRPRILGGTVDMGAYEMDSQPFLFLSLPLNAREGDGLLHAAGMVSVTNPVLTTLAVSLQSSAPAKISVTDTVHIVAGQTNTSFDVIVEDDSDLGGNPVAVTISASATNYTTNAGVIHVSDDDVGTLSVRLNGPLQEGAGTVGNAGTLQIDRPPGNAVSVGLTSSAPAILQVPATVLVPAGATNHPFSATVVEDSQITGPRMVTVTAFVTNWVSGSNTVMILDNESTNLTLMLPSQAIESAGILANVGRVSLAGSLPQDLAISLISSVPSAAIVPPSVTITAGLTQATFNLSIPNDTQYGGDRVTYVSASAPGFVPAERPLVVLEDDALYFGFSAIDSPQTNGMAFPVMVTAYGDGTNVQTHYEGFVSLTTHSDVGLLSLFPSEVDGFRNGVWSGTLVIEGTADAVFLRAISFSAWGTSGNFDVVPAPLDHFTWATIDVPQYADEAFPVTITARDARGLQLANFTQAADLSATDGHGAAGPTIVISEINHGTPDAVEFVNASAVDVDVSGWTITLYQSTGWPAPLPIFTIPSNTVAAPGQVFVLAESGVAPGTFPNLQLGSDQNINWTQTTRAAVLLRDAAGTIIDFACANNATPASISMPVTISTNHWSGAPIAPPPSGTVDYQRVGVADTQSSNDWRHATSSIGSVAAELILPFASGRREVPLLPTNTTPFTAGIWSGHVRIPVASSNVVLRGTNPALGASGESAEFPVLPTDTDADGDQLRDAWERQNFGGLARDGTNDFDHDGMSDAGEHEAGTSPTNALDVLRTTAISLSPPNAAWHLEWPTVSGRYYTVLSATNLLAPTTWQTNPAFVRVPSAGAPLSFSNSPAERERQFYKVKVQRRPD